jgi:hypothetical protein
MFINFVFCMFYIYNNNNNNINTRNEGLSDTKSDLVDSIDIRSDLL